MHTELSGCRVHEDATADGTAGCGFDGSGIMWRRMAVRLRKMECDLDGDVCVGAAVVCYFKLGSLLVPCFHHFVAGSVRS